MQLICRSTSSGKGRGGIVERAQNSDRLLSLAAVLFAAIFALRVSDRRPGDAILVLCVVPIVLCAIARGRLGGAAAATVSVALGGLWGVYGDGDIGPLGYGARITSFLVVGVIVGHFVSARDAVERRLDRSYEVAIDLQCTAGRDGRFKRINPAGCRLLGFTEAQLLALRFVELVHPEDRERTRRETERLFTGDGRTVDFENRYRTSDGSYRWLAWTARVSDGVVYASARDITAQRDQRDTLKRLVIDRTRDLQAARLETLHRLALAAEYRDDDTQQHTVRVAALARMLAQRLGEPAGFVAQLHEAAPLHDIGKLGVSDAILLKPGRLTPEERSIMQAHTTIGASILSGSAFPALQLAEQVALSHHERWDGTGYPNRLRGEQIPLAARIVAVADVFDALVQARPYKPAWPLEQAVAEIRAGSGTQFDARLVAAFDVLERDGSLQALMTHGAALPHVTWAEAA
jgi:PAS domain S-box-containing protein/putative nucleotidyltransferase with HDIG domain